MIKLGILSDTHGYLPLNIIEFLKPCNLIIHAGDIGTPDIITSLSDICPVKGVWGNIDGTNIRTIFPEFDVFKIEDVSILVMHIGGYPPKYNSNSIKLIKKLKPNLFIAGHSHILRVHYDKENELLYINPGAAGKYGFHTHITAIRLEITENRFENLEVFDQEK